MPAFRAVRVPSSWSGTSGRTMRERSWSWACPTSTNRVKSSFALLVPTIQLLIEKLTGW